MRRADLLRILDANLNRAAEGTRVSEEIARFVLGAASVTRRLKALRHGIHAAAVRSRIPVAERLRARDSRGDVGREASPLEAGRADASALFLANVQRAKEALRVLEEVSKSLEAGGTWKYFKQLRFELYDIEKDVLPRLEALHDRGAVRRGSWRARAPRRGGPARGRRRRPAQG